MSSEAATIREQANTIAMTLALLSVAMLFAALMLGYVLLRANAPVWPPMGMERANLFYPTLSTLLIVISSACYSRWPRVTLLLGLGFLLSQGLLWAELKHSGLYASAGIFPSIIYGLTWAHAGHLVVALFFLLAMIVLRQWLRHRGSERAWMQNVGKLWHFLGVIWLVLYFSVFVF